MAETKQSDLKDVSSSPGKNRFDWVAGVFVFFWPMIYMINHIIPIKGQYVAASNDFMVLYYRYKVYLLACLNQFKFPLWSPSEAAGFPFYSNPFAQAFYPLNLPLVLWYKLRAGYNPWDHQLFTIIGISIFALGLYKWLRLINKNLRAVILSTVIISVSFKMTEIMRFPNAIHSAAWYPWVLYAITKIFISKTLKGRIFSGLMLVFFIICLCTGGYPYYVYYSQFLFLPYFLIFVIRPLRKALLGIDSLKLKPAVITLSICGFISGLICLPYLLSIRHLMLQVTDRAGKSFSYSTDFVFNIVDTVGSLVYPPAAVPEGWYFFSITALFIIFLYLLAKSGEKPSVDSPPSEGVVKLVFILWIAIITYITYGKDSYLFIFLWNYMPGFSSLRVWGRMNIILLPILAWLLSRAFNYFEGVIGNSSEQKGFWKKNQTIITLGVVYAVVLCAQYYLVSKRVFDLYWSDYLGFSKSAGMWFVYIGIAAFLIVLLILVIARKYAITSNKALIAITVLLAFTAAVEMWPIGTHTWAINNNTLDFRFNFDVDKMNQASFNYRRIEGDNYRRFSISIQPIFSVGFLPNWYFERYMKFFEGKADDLESQRMLLGVTTPQKVFFSESITYNTVREFLTDSLRFGYTGYPWLYTGDKLEWKMKAPVKGYVSFIDNWDSSWKAYVDGKEEKIELLFGTFKSVAVEKGEHQIEFVYKPTLKTALGIGENTN